MAINKNILILVIIIFVVGMQGVLAQLTGVIPGTLSVKPSFGTASSGEGSSSAQYSLQYQTKATNTPLEAGLDAGLVDVSQKAYLDFKLDSQTVLVILNVDDDVICMSNLYDYDVYMSTQDFPQTNLSDVKIEARVVNSSGTIYPSTLPTPGLSGAVLGLLGLSALNQTVFDAYEAAVIGNAVTPAQGGSWIQLSDESQTPIKVFSFRGCRTDLEVEFKFTINNVIYSVPDFKLNYFVVATDLIDYNTP
ncbi:hypothetical protein [Tenacibaculum haliotis]|uniref:hypothetical protein n=1 Tax=Tenacibaculum haliotis TaxID=1888914 RepID=UPI0021AFD4E0|nr:hypothetical protein [Tenacibaculum haliotis]MCT4700000.1 hypothetical protein [Tenacibaculum haliotis]